MAAVRPEFRAPGEYMWMCTRCNAYPATKWPHGGGATAGTLMHLGYRHSVGMMTGTGRPNLDMIELSR